MSGDPCTFLGEVATPLVRHGADQRLPDDHKTGEVRHTLPAVYGEMLLQVTTDYPALPDPRELRISEIRFFYEGLRVGLRERTKPR